MWGVGNKEQGAEKRTMLTSLAANDISKKNAIDQSGTQNSLFNLPKKAKAL